MPKKLTICALLVTALLATATTAQAQIGTKSVVPVPLPERPFLLVEANRRFLPTEPSRVKIQLRDGGRLHVSLFRVHDPEAIIGQAGRRQGLTIARSALGDEAEQLLRAFERSRTPRARRGQQLTLLRHNLLSMPGQKAARRVVHESTVYDSFEDEESVATYWVRRGRWSVRNFSFGRLPTGLYLVRVHAGPWATTALLSVGELVVLARRGANHDVVLVTNRDGAPLRDVEVEARAASGEVRRARTNAQGEARLPARDELTLRYLVRRGDDVAWADVGHARLDSCDPRIYVATGRPVYRTNETIYVRGQVRGCEGGRFRGLSNQAVQLWVGSRPTEEDDDELITVRSDAQGNFTAELRATGGEIGAAIDGQPHTRPLRIDSRRLPRRALVLRTDRQWTTPGQTFRVIVADEDGGWPRRRNVVLTTPTGRQVATIGPEHPAIFFVRTPATDSPFERLELTATLTDGGRTTIVADDIISGRHPTLIDLDAGSESGEPGQSFEVSIEATDLLGAPAPGNLALALHRSDGNHPLGQPLWEEQISISDGGHIDQQIPLRGEGPWLLLARRDGAQAQMMIWERGRPPSLARTGELALIPNTPHVEPGHELELRARLPGGPGRSWLTLEQGDVLLSRLLPAGPRRIEDIAITVPERARGLATLVLSRIEAGRIETTTTSLDVETSREITLDVETDRRRYDEGERAHVTIRARDAEGTPADAVISLWLADAGYWDLGRETYPTPTDYFRLPGRSATAGDSTSPLGYGAEEGRVLEDAAMSWDGQRLDDASFRHAWGYGGELIDIEARGTFGEIATALARRIGLRGAEVCDEAAARVGETSLSVTRLPWDLAVMRIAEATDTSPEIGSDVLTFMCGGYGGFGLGSLGGGGSGCGYGAGGLGLIGGREQRLEGTLFFAGLQRLGADGLLELDVPLPDHPGRWRIEVLGIADDGGGGRAHQRVETTRPLEGWLDLARRLRPGDDLRGAIHVRARQLAGQQVALQVEADEPLELVSELPTEVRLDADGRAEVPLQLRAQRAGEAELRLRLTSEADANLSDSLRLPVEILTTTTRQPVTLRTLLGPEAREVQIPLPPLAAPATIHVTTDRRLDLSMQDLLEALRRPVWNIPATRIDRLVALRSLSRALGELPHSAPYRDIRLEVRRALRGEATALANIQSITGGLPWWQATPDSPLLTATALEALGDLAAESEWGGAWSQLRRRVDDQRRPLDVESAALMAWLFAQRHGEEDQRRAAELLPSEQELRSASLRLDTLVWAARAAEELHEEERSEALLEQLERQLRQRIASDAEPPAVCRGPAWFLCFARWGERGAVARAATALVTLHHPNARALAADVASWLAALPPAQGWWSWGSDEADIIALLAVAGTPDDENEPVTAFIDGRPTPIDNHAIQIPRGAGRLTLRFPARENRLRPVLIDGSLEAEPPQTTIGPTRFERHFNRESDHRWTLELAITSEGSAEDVELVVPLPAGLELAPDADHPEGTRLARTDLGIELLLPSLNRGVTQIELPLIPQGQGRFTAGSATLHSARGEHWAVTPITVLQI